MSSVWSDSTVPTNVDGGPDSPVQLGVKFRPEVNGKITGIRFYKSTGNTGTHVGNLWDLSGTNLASATFSSETTSGWQQVNFSTPVSVTAGTVYVASYHTTVGHYSYDKAAFSTAGIDSGLLHVLKDGESGSNGVYGYGNSGTFPSSANPGINYWVDVVFSPSGSSIWPTTAAPVTSDVNDNGSVEVGVRFQSDVDGSVSAIRFYKGVGNTGTHVATLWSATGTNLGSTTFTNETASGWQQAEFTSPVSITANTTYVASYHCPVGHYAGDHSAFATAGVDNAPLHALKDGVSGPNGCFKYAASSVFPDTAFMSSNYWVDVVFVPAKVATTTSLVSSVNPVVSGQQVTFTVTVTASSGTAKPTGTVTFYDGTTVIGTGVLS